MSLIRGRPPDERYAARQQRTRVELNEIKAWLNQVLSQPSAKSALAGAIGYRHDAELAAVVGYLV